MGEHKLMNDRLLMMTMNQERVDQLLGKPVKDLVEMIIRYEEELDVMKDYRKRLVQIRNIATDPDERRPKGRPRKEN